jgi:hypothetical protein
VRDASDSKGISSGLSNCDCPSKYEFAARRESERSGWRTGGGLAWNGHKKNCEMTELIWREKMACQKLKIAPLHENADERKPSEEIPWKSQLAAMRG